MFSSSPAKPFMALPLMSLFALLFFVGIAAAQTRDLITPIPSNQLRAATPDQTQALDRIKDRPTTQSVDLVDVNVNALRGDSVRLLVPNTNPITLSRSKEDVRNANDFTWYGTLGGVPGQATLVVRGGNITGTIQDQGNLYRIEPVGNGVHALIKVDQARFPPEHPPSFQQKERQGDIQMPPTVRDTNRGDAPVGIDVLVAYTTGAKNAVSDINATIALAVAEANQSYVNSGVTLRLKLVDSFEVSYSESGKTYEQILADFVANSTVQSRRDSSGADLAAMIINQTDFCGLADAIMANASTAFAVVHYDCATGYYSFAHELGHLMGARHDEIHDPSTTPFAYGHGDEHPSSTASQVFRTIMAYACDPPKVCNPRIQYWSSPNVTYAGIPTGTAATNDNVRVLNGTAATVAAFRSPGTPGGKTPLAFGTLLADGQKASGTSNWTSVYNATYKRYEITIQNEDYYYLKYATAITPAGDVGYCRSSSVSGKLLVYCSNQSGQAASSRFAFAVYKP